MNSRDNRKVLRVKLERPLKVIMGSIGSDVKYDLLTNDISPNGFFLDFEAPGRFPFNPSSIMEVWLYLEENDEIFFNGKMARVVYPSESLNGENRPGIAIRIIQIGDDEKRRLATFIDEKSRLNATEVFEEEFEEEQENDDSGQDTEKNEAQGQQKKSDEKAS